MNTYIPVNRKIAQTVRNLVDEGHLSDFKAELELIVAKIYQLDCGIVCEKLEKSSWLTQTAHKKNRGLMHIGLKDRWTPVDIIWSILHEFGHLLQDVEELPVVEEDIALKYFREKDAWDRAEIEMKTYPKLASLAKQFYSYRDAQLISYQKGS